MPHIALVHIYERNASKSKPKPNWLRYWSNFFTFRSHFFWIINWCSHRLLFLSILCHPLCHQRHSLKSVLLFFLEFYSKILTAILWVLTQVFPWSYQKYATGSFLVNKQNLSFFFSSNDPEFLHTQIWGRYFLLMSPGITVHCEGKGNYVIWPTMVESYHWL